MTQVPYLRPADRAAKLVIVMPAYRAEQTLEKTVASIPNGLTSNLILVDDASPDRTAEIARSLGIKVHVHPETRGYGGNQKTCYAEALREGADIVVLLHPDYQYDPRAVPLLIAPIIAGDADMTFGSRFAGLGDPRGGGMPLYRFVGNRLTTVAENLMLGSRFTETHSGLRAYTRKSLLSLPFLGYSDDFVFDSQLLVDAVTTGQRVVEVPIPTRYTAESSSIAVGASLRYVAGSVAYCARRTAARGRRGRRSPVVARGGKPARLGAGPRVERPCALCRGDEQELVWPGTGVAPGPDEFACTAPAGARHGGIVQCRSCGMVSSVPSVTPDEALARYRAAEDPAYLEGEAERRQGFRDVLRLVGGYPTEGRSLFEVGAGAGLFLDEARRAGWDARGIEPSGWAVRTGRDRFGVELSEGTVEALQGPSMSADAVVALDVLEHLEDPLAALEMLRVIVRPEGVLALSTLNIAGRHARARGREWPWLTHAHRHYFTPQTLERMLDVARFRVVEWRNAPRRFPLSYVARRGGLGDGAVARAASKGGGPFGARLPWGWLGDVVLVIARPDRAGW